MNKYEKDMADVLEALINVLDTIGGIDDEMIQEDLVRVFATVEDMVADVELMQDSADIFNH